MYTSTSSPSDKSNNKVHKNIFIYGNQLIWKICLTWNLYRPQIATRYILRLISECGNGGRYSTQVEKVNTLD